MAKVLVAEDEEAMLEIFGEVIEGLGYTVRRARDGEEALLLAQADVPDLVVSDQMMPRRTGIELLRALRADPTTADVPFLLISAAQPKGAEDADKFLSKPFDIDAFEAAVEHTLRIRRESRGRAKDVVVSSALVTRRMVLEEEVLNWVAHELKTPLASARLNAQMLVRRLAAHAEEEEAKRADAIMHQLDRMNGLIASVLDAARLSEGKVALELDRVDLSQVVREVASRWQASHPEAQIEVAGVDVPLEAMVDAGHLRTILDNLVSNAVKHTEDGKPVTISVERTSAAFLILVQDEGRGIPAADLPRIFDRFFRAESGGSGHGLGLYIAASLARLHGGTLSAQSVLGRGSTFTLRLPNRN